MKKYRIVNFYENNFQLSTLEERIRRIRGDTTLSQFADKLSSTGYPHDKGKLSKYETGYMKPATDFYTAIAKLGYNINWLLTGEGEIYTGKEDIKSAELKREIVRLKEENESVKKMVGLEAYKYIQSQLSSVKNSPQKPSKTARKKPKKDC